MAPRVFPESVRTMHASRTMRQRHELWHFVRAVWNHPRFPEEARQILRDLGWGLPEGRGPLGPDGLLLLDNFAGEDFLFMHRRMIAMTDRALDEVGEPPISRWETVPEPGDTEFPIPPAWEYADPRSSAARNARMTDFLVIVKSSAYYERTMRVRERFLTEPGNLARMSLGALGNLAEMTIHNAMHMRWSSDPGAYRPGFDPEDPTGGDPDWDVLGYDYLGDTYSSHVNPHFWHLHGWVDNLIDQWAQANRVEEIEWTGTWLGGPDLEEPSHPMEEMSGATAAPHDAGDVRSKLARLAQITAGLPFPTSLAEIAAQLDE